MKLTLEVLNVANGVVTIRLPGNRAVNLTAGDVYTFSVKVGP